MALYEKDCNFPLVTLLGTVLLLLPEEPAALAEALEAGAVLTRDLTRLIKMKVVSRLIHTLFSSVSINKAY